MVARPSRIPRVAVAPGRRHRRAERRDRRAHEPAGLQQVDVEVEEALVRARAPRAAVDDAAHVAAVRRGRAAGEELDLVDEHRVDDAGPGQQVKQQRDARAVEQEARRAGARAAHDRERQQRHDRRHAGQRLDHPERIAERARDLLDLVAAQRDARDLVAPPLGDDDGLVEVVAFALDEVGHRQLLPGRERLLLHEGVVLGREDRDARGAGRQRQAKVPAGVGLGPVVLVADAGDDGRGRERAARAELDEAAAQRRP